MMRKTNLESYWFIFVFPISKTKKVFRKLQQTTTNYHISSGGFLSWLKRESADKKILYLSPNLKFYCLCTSKDTWCEDFEFRKLSIDSLNFLMINKIFKLPLVEPKCLFILEAITNYHSQTIISSTEI